MMWGRQFREGLHEVLPCLQTLLCLKVLLKKKTKNIVLWIEEQEIDWTTPGCTLYTVQSLLWQLSTQKVGHYISQVVWSIGYSHANDFWTFCQTLSYLKTNAFFFLATFTISSCVLTTDLQEVCKKWELKLTIKTLFFTSLTFLFLEDIF